jgi:soluble lytic murein transglycosylase-like protein
MEHREAAGRPAQRLPVRFALAAVSRLVAISILLLLAPRADANGPLYRYIDASGTVHFTNVSKGRRYHRVFLTERGLVRGGVGRRPDPKQPPEYAGYDWLISRAAAAYDLDPALVKAVIAAESNFDRRAVSRAGAQGLMQLMPKTAQSVGVSDPLEPTQNVLGGVRYLREMLDRYGDTTRALAAYNAGPTAVDRHGGVPPFRETQAYVERVLDYYRGYHRDFRRAAEGPGTQRVFPTAHSGG